MIDAFVIGLRALSFVAALEAAGMPLFLWLFGDGLRSAARPIAAAATRAALLGLLATIGYQLAEPARLAGGLHGIFDGSLQAAMLDSEVGTATAVRVLGLALAAGGGLVETRRIGAAASLFGGALTVVSFALMGHTAGHDQRWLLAPLLIVHLAIIAFWFGALWPLSLASRYEAAGTHRLAIERFSALAVGLVPVIFVAGLALSLLLLPSLATLRTPYGLLLLGKVGGFALLMGLAALNKWRLGPAIGAGNTKALRRFRTTVLVEWLLIAGILVATAAMTGLFSPEH